MVDKKYGNTDCKMYPDMREFLAKRTDIDAVLIAHRRPVARAGRDHGHAGGQGRVLRKALVHDHRGGPGGGRRGPAHGRIYQTGTQRLSEANFVFCIEMARSGRLGEVHTAYAAVRPRRGRNCSHDWLPAMPEPPKDGLDWDAWLGPCPWRPYNSEYTAGGWRGHYDFHTSCIGVWAAHTFAQCQAGINTLDTSPSNTST